MPKGDVLWGSPGVRLRTPLVELLVRLSAAHCSLAPTVARCVMRITHLCWGAELGEGEDEGRGGYGMRCC